MSVDKDEATSKAITKALMELIADHDLPIISTIEKFLTTFKQSMDESARS